MVRLKHRYLVLHILYPTTLSLSHGSITTPKPTLLHLHRPTVQSIDVPHLLRLIKSSIEYMYGDYGLGLILPSLKIVYFSPATSTAIIRVARAHYRILWASLTWMTSLGKGGGTKTDGERQGEGGQCVIRVVRVCGTIRKAEEEVVRRAREAIGRVKEGGELGLGLGLGILEGKDDKEREVESDGGLSEEGGLGVGSGSSPEEAEETEEHG